MTLIDRVGHGKLYAEKTSITDDGTDIALYWRVTHPLLKNEMLFHCAEDGKTMLNALAYYHNKKQQQQQTLDS